MKLYDAPRCPYCARARLALAEKAIEYETVEIDLENRPAWLYELNPLGKVPVLDDGFPLPESVIVMEYLEERFPEPSLLPPDHPGRARARLAVLRFDDLLGDDYYALRRGEDNAVAARLAALPVGESLYVDFAYLPWVMRLRELFGVTLPERVEHWLVGLCDRPAVAAELEVVRGAPMSEGSIEAEELARRLGAVTLVDVRRPEEFDGTLGAPCDPRQGHIPGAVNLPMEELVFLSHDEVRERLGIADGEEIVAYCHSGSRSATAVQILAGLGYDARNYSGSWHEWSRTDLPLETE